jgi:uncharacterized protein YjbI with pentapeptide repeats
MPLRTVKPLSLGLMSKAYTQAGHHRLVIAALGFFELGTPVEALRNDFLSFPTLAAALPAGEPLDPLYPKARGEVLVAAQAFAPKAKAVEEMPVRICIGTIDKTLRVLGDREVKQGLLGAHAAQPVPFTHMALDWRRAYGGPQHPCNPAGVGYTGKRKSGALPNLEYPNQPIRHGNQDIPPAGFGPRSVLCPDRQTLFGTFDKHWREQYAPHLPADFDPAAFNAAPADQQLQGWFQGGETYRLEGLHPTQPVLAGRLPDFRVRILMQRHGQTPAQAEETPTRLDTVWMVPHARLAVCVYRAVIDCADSDAEDIAAVLAAYEDTLGATRPLAHYRDALAKRTNIETRHLHVFNDAPLIPEPDAATVERRRAAHATAEAEELAKRQALLDEMDAEFWADTDMEPPADYKAPKAEPNPLGLITAEAIANGEVDLTEVMARADALVADAEKQGKEQLAELERRRESGDIAEAMAAATPAPADPEQEKREAAARAELNPPSALGDAITAANASGQLTPEQAQQLRQADGQLHTLQSKARGMAVKPTRDPVSAEVAAHLRMLVQGWLAAGAPLAGRDLGGADLHDLDFSGLDLSACNLEGANLSNACFDGASMAQSVLVGATLNDTQFEQADLSEANLNRVKGKRVQLRGATLDKVSLIEAALPEADLRVVRATGLLATETELRKARLDGAHLNECVLMGLKATESQWRSAHLSNSVLYGAELAVADFSEARLSKAILSGVQAPASRWDGARLEKSLLNLADLSGARFHKLLATLSSWRDSALEGSDWHNARLLRCDLCEARLDRADLQGASFAHCLLMRASLFEADARRADFFQALLRKANLQKADLRESNLVRALDAEVDYRDARMEHAVRTARGEAA